MLSGAQLQAVSGRQCAMPVRESVCFITENRSFGGVEVHTLGLMDALIRRGYTIELVENRYDGYDDIVRARDWKEHVHIIHTDLDGILYGERTDLRQWRKVLASLRSRILVFPKGNNNYGQIRLLRLCRRQFERIVLIEHLEPYAKPRAGKRWFGVVPGFGLWWRRRRLFSRLGAACADHIIAVSEQVRRRLVDDFDYAADRLSVVRNGVAWRELQRNEAVGREFRERHDIEPDGFVFGMLTRLSPEKGIDLALHALQRLLSGNPARRPYLVIAGQGNLREQLEQLAERLGVREHVRFIGP